MDYRTINAQRDLIRDAKIAHLAELRAAGVRTASRPVTYEPETFKAPERERVSTFEGYNRMMNNRARPYPWMDVGAGSIARDNICDSRNRRGGDV